MSGDARDFNNMETRAVIRYFFLQGKVPKEIHAMHHHMPQSKTGWSSLNMVIFPPVICLVLDDPKQ